MGRVYTSEPVEEQQELAPTPEIVVQSTPEAKEIDQVHAIVVGITDLHEFQQLPEQDQEETDRVLRDNPTLALEIGDAAIDHIDNEAAFIATLERADLPQPARDLLAQYQNEIARLRKRLQIQQDMRDRNIEAARTGLDDLREIGGDEEDEIYIAAFYRNRTALNEYLETNEIDEETRTKILNNIDTARFITHTDIGAIKRVLEAEGIEFDAEQFQDIIDRLQEEADGLMRDVGMSDYVVRRSYERARSYRTRDEYMPRQRGRSEMPSFQLQDIEKMPADQVLRAIMAQRIQDQQRQERERRRRERERRGQEALEEEVEEQSPEERKDRAERLRRRLAGLISEASESSGIPMTEERAMEEARSLEEDIRSGLIGIGHNESPAKLSPRPTDVRSATPRRVFVTIGGVDFRDDTSDRRLSRLFP